MRLEIEQNHLQTLIARVIGAVKSRQTIPILGNVKLTATTTLQAEATDLDMSIQATQPAQVTIQGSTTVNAQMLSGIVSKLPKGSLVSLNHDGQFLHIQAGRSKFKISTLPVEDFPVMASNEYESRLEFQGLELKNALEKTVWAASTEETRYYLQGVLMQRNEGRATFTATDGHRLAHYQDGEVSEFPDVIIPTSAVKQFIGALNEGDAVLEVSETKIRLSHGDVVIVSKTIDGTYPDWQRVLPKNNDNSIQLPSVDAKAAIERVSVVATERTRSVKFSVSDGELTLSVTDANGGSATEVLTVDQSGAGVDIGFNSKYTLEALAQADKGNVVIHYADAMSPALVTYEKEPGFKAVIMPMRIG